MIFGCAATAAVSVGLLASAAALGGRTEGNRGTLSSKCQTWYHFLDVLFTESLRLEKNSKINKYNL